MYTNFYSIPYNFFGVNTGSHLPVGIKKQLFSFEASLSPTKPYFKLVLFFHVNIILPGKLIVGKEYFFNLPLLRNMHFGSKCAAHTK